MIKEDYKNVCEGAEIRANLIKIKKEIKEADVRRALAYELAGDFSVFVQLLQNEDPKIRKNAALILGELESEDLVPILYEAYGKEDKLFIKCDYLKAISNYNYQAYMQPLKERLEELRGQKAAEENAKHVREESAMLQSMILKYEKPAKHKFIGTEKQLEVILLTNRNHREVVETQIREYGDEIKMLAGGLRISTSHLGEIMPVRTYQELLFPIKGALLISGTPQEMAEQLYRSGMMMFLREMHEGKEPFFYRIELKSKMPMDKKGPFIKKLSAEMEQRCKGKLINSASDYEVELRLVENKAGGYIPLLKLYTITDQRFAYRKESISTSIIPSNGALIMELVKDYLKEDAQILDPFCGVGTMLIERNKAAKANPMYGIDILEEAIDKARINTRLAGVIINYIQRDFSDFKHDYLFDEIITNMPGVSKTKDRFQLEKIYNQFFVKAEELLKEDGCIILYTDEKDILYSSLRGNGGFKIVKEEVIHDRDDSRVYVLKPTTRLHKSREI